MGNDWALLLRYATRKGDEWDLYQRCGPILLRPNPIPEGGEIGEKDAKVLIR